MPNVGESFVTKGIGALDQPDDPRDWDAGVLIRSASDPLPESVDLSRYIDGLGIRDQETSNACVGFAVTTAAYIRAKIVGIPNVVPSSPLALYALGRATAVGDPRTPLMDVGSQPRLVLNAAAKWGLVPESAWQFSLATVNQRPTWSALDRGVGYELRSYYWLNSWGQGRVDDVCMALALGYPVVCSIAVDDSLDGYVAGNVMRGATGRIRGNHMVTIVGFRPGTTGVEFRMVNSWGSGWGDGGMAWIGHERISDTTTRSIAVIQTVPGEP